MNCGWGHSTVFCVKWAVGTCLCVLMWDQLHHCEGLFRSRQRQKHIDDLFDDSLWDCSWHVSFVCEQPSSLVYSMSPRITRSKTFCFLFSVLSYAERSFLSIFSLCFVLQCLSNWDIDGRVNVLKQWDIHRSLYTLNVRGVLFEILLGCGKGLPLVDIAAISSC